MSEVSVTNTQCITNAACSVGARQIGRAFTPSNDSITRRADGADSLASMHFGEILGEGVT